jgi:hypothetical protein
MSESGKVPMADKFEIYDVIGVLVPGTLLICVLPLFFPSLISTASAVKFPDAFAVIALTAAAILGGHVVQAISSLVEPIIYFTWGGRPSDRVFTKGLGNRYLPLELAIQIKEKLKAAYGANLSDRSLFVKAMQRAETGPGRVARFNALYAYHRAVLTLTLIVTILFLASFHAGLATAMTKKQDVGMLISLLLFLGLSWHRAKQRGFYYAKEVLLKAEHALEEKKPSEEKKSD